MAEPEEELVSRMYSGGIQGQSMRTEEVKEGRKDSKYIISSTAVGSWAQFHWKHLISRSSPDTILTWVLPKSRIRDKDLWAGILFWSKSRM